MASRLWGYTFTNPTDDRPRTTGTVLVSIDHLCPDLLRYEQIGAADGLRGRVVRGFFWLMRLWPPRSKGDGT